MNNCGKYNAGLYFEITKQYILLMTKTELHVNIILIDDYKDLFGRSDREQLFNFKVKLQLKLIPIMGSCQPPPNSLT